MDISTTPPPPVIDDVSPEPVTSTLLPVQPPPPPRIKSPTPPPPPTISKTIKQKKKVLVKSNSNLPPLPEILPPLPDEKFTKHGEPLPPGVDSSEITPYGSPPSSRLTKETPQSNANDVLGSALNSFYSDLAAMETEVITASVVPEISKCVDDIVPSNVTAEVPAKRKKKSKVKLVQGLAMKKKGVSKLVERWKNVQKDYN